jgi:hypothetical protein
MHAEEKIFRTDPPTPHPSRHSVMRVRSAYVFEIRSCSTPSSNSLNTLGDQKINQTLVVTPSMLSKQTWTNNTTYRSWTEISSCPSWTEISTRNIYLPLINIYLPLFLFSLVSPPVSWPGCPLNVYVADE